MSYKPYTVLAPKAAVADPEPLRKKAAELAKDCGLSQSEHWFAWRGDDWVFGFANNANPAIAFICYCAKSGIPFRPTMGEGGGSHRRMAHTLVGWVDKISARSPA
jgi:hypothetical protein